MALATDNLVNQNIAKLLPGLIELARRCGVELSARPTTEELTELREQWCNSKIFGKNVPAIAAALGLTEEDIPDRTILDLLQGTGSIDRIDMRSVYQPVALPDRVNVIVPGATANQITRRRNELHRYMTQGVQPAMVHTIGNGRVCDLESEVSHPGVMNYREVYGRFPTEGELLSVQFPELGAIHTPHAFDDIVSLQAQIEAIWPSVRVNGYPIYVPVNGNATFVALAVRRFIKNVEPGFDSDPHNPQFLFSQDGWDPQSGQGVSLARTPDQWLDQAHYQRPMTVFSGLARLAEELALLNP